MSNGLINVEFPVFAACIPTHRLIVIGLVSLSSVMCSTQTVGWFEDEDILYHLKVRVIPWLVQDLIVLSVRPSSASWPGESHCS